MAHGPSLTRLIWMSWRNIIAKNRRTGLSFMTIVSILGVAIGVAALIVVLSVMGGFENDLKSKMLRGQPHLEIMAEQAAAGFGLVDVPLATFRKAFPEATDMQPFTQADVVLKQRKHMTSAVLFGVDPQRDSHLWGFSGSVVEGEFKDIGKMVTSNAGWVDKIKRPGVALGEDLAIQLGADIGDEVHIMSPQANIDTALGGGTVSRTFVVAAKFRTGLFNYDAKWAVVSLSEGRRFMPDYDDSLQVDRFVSGVAMNFADPFVTETLVTRLGGAQKSGDVATSGPFTGLKALTWQNVNKSLLFALKLEKFAMGSILMLIVLVAAFSISGTMMMTVFHRRGQVSLLRSLGMTQRHIAKLYLVHGFTIGTVGIALGLAAGLAMVALIGALPEIPLPEGVYHLKSLPSKWLWMDYVVIAAAAWVFSLLAATYPALTAARQDPGMGLRYL